jgi:FkbH-like protein
MGQSATASRRDEILGEVASSLSGREVGSIPPTAYGALARRIASLEEEPDASLLFAGNVTLDLLAPLVSVLAAREGMIIRGRVGGLGQHFREMLEPPAWLDELKPDLALLFLSLRLLRPDAVGGIGALSSDSRRSLCDEVLEHAAQWVDLASQRLDATLVLANFVTPSRPALGIADGKEDFGEIEMYTELNLGLQRRFRSHPRVQVLDLDRLVGELGRSRSLDQRMFYLAKTEWSRELLPLVAQEVVRHLIAAQGRARKCVVVDLDNTLWGGVVGEDVMEGLRLGPGDPEGEAFVEFQRRLKELSKRGILLAICSKNNEGDALQVLDDHPHMVLQRDDFSAMEISWEPKPTGLERIARALNIGLDSLVFIDDNPAETTLVEQTLPQVKTLLLGRDPADHVRALDALVVFEKVRVLEEDALKAERYRQNSARVELERSSLDLGSYLHSLGSRARISRVTKEGLARAHQLFTKTNQFNLTTRRPSLGEVERMLSGESCELWQMEAGDRFGELGIIALAHLSEADDTLWIDSLLMSCRAMGRGLEIALLNHVKERLLSRSDRIGRLCGRFRRTAKNQPVVGFYRERGFSLLERLESGEEVYVLSRGDSRLEPCDWISLETT